MGVAIRDVLVGGWARQQKTSVCFTSCPKGFCIRLLLYPADSDALLNCSYNAAPESILSGAPLVMVSIWGRKRTLADKTVYSTGSTDTSFDPPLIH